jgi:hypothetical protein
MGWRRALEITTVLSAVLLAPAACVVNETRTPDRSVVVAGPPPPPVDEAPPPPRPPGANQIWIRGGWHWTGVQWAWIPGHWDHPPEGMRAWHAPHYSFVDGTYRYEPGTWAP